MAKEDGGGFDFDEYMRSLGAKDPVGKFLKHVGPEDLDEQGRFICKEPVLVIGANAFRDVWDKLTYVKIDGVISIENEAFANCGKLKKADIGFELDYLYLQNYDTHMFWKDKQVESEEDYEKFLEEYSGKFGNYSVNIKDDAFKNCVSLQSFHFPSRIVLYGSPFRRCNSMTELTFDGSITLRISANRLKTLREGERAMRAITFKDCNNVQKINFGKGVKFHLDELAQFENLKEINLNCDFFERKKFWRDAISNYPQFFLMLPTDLYKDTNYARQCLYPVPDVLEDIYGFPACKFIYKNLISSKEKIEKKKAKERRIASKRKNIDDVEKNSRIK